MSRNAFSNVHKQLLSEVPSDITACDSYMNFGKNGILDRKIRVIIFKFKLKINMYINMKIKMSQSASN